MQQIAQLLTEALQVLLFPGILFIIFLAFLWEWLDRKAFARMQNRKGPSYSGWGGILQPYMDFLKLLGKEDLTPSRANKRSFSAVPIVMLILSILMCMFLPIVDMDSIKPGVQGIISFEGDLILLLFISTFMAATIILAGYFSSNPFGQTGAARTGMLLVSFEIPLIISLVSPAVLTGSLNLSTIVTRLTESSWLYPVLLVIPFIIFLVSMQAELERIPFDVSHAETEIVHGWQVEFSGKKLAFIHLSEDIMMVYAAGLATTLFLGGPFLFEFIPFLADFGIIAATTWVGWIYYPLVFSFKSAIVVLVFSNIRAAFARWRIDQIVHAAWRIMVPLAILNLIVIHLALGFIFPALGVQ